MNGELSAGLPALLTRGNRILRADNLEPILLRGVNRSGLEYSEPGATGFLAGAQIDQDEIGVIVRGWHANVLRLPFNQDWCLNGRGAHCAEAYLASLDQVIAWAAALGAYTILDLQWLDLETAYGTTFDPIQGRTTNHVPPTPNQQTIELWRILAARYRNEPAVLFDLLNEPHDALDDDPYPIKRIDANGRVSNSTHRRVSATDWVRWATVLTTEIRKIRPDGLILVSGTDWAFDLSGIWIDAPNIVYSTHIYPNRSTFVWRKAIGQHRKLPIFIGEWGGTERDLAHGAKLARKLRKLGLGWTAWSWSDFPHLVASRASGFQPTPFGELVRNELRSFPS
jgi:endoglucanase